MKSFSLTKDGFTFKGFEPTMARKNAPVFMWIDGTHCNWNDPADLNIVQQMAKRGFISATLKQPYDNSILGYPKTCSRFESRVNRIVAALNVLCTRGSADCSKGIALAGFSQGANLVNLVAGRSNLLKNPITAIFTIAGGNNPTSGP